MSAKLILVSAAQVFKTYASGRLETSALHAISLEINAGELTLLMGPSGSGKTTLLSILSGLMRPTSGTVSLCGVAISECSERVSADVRR